MREFFKNISDLGETICVLRVFDSHGTAFEVYLVKRDSSIYYRFLESNGQQTGFYRMDEFKSIVDFLRLGSGKRFKL